MNTPLASILSPSHSRLNLNLADFRSSLLSRSSLLRLIQPALTRRKRDNKKQQALLRLSVSQTTAVKSRSSPRLSSKLKKPYNQKERLKEKREQVATLTKQKANLSRERRRRRRRT